MFAFFNLLERAGRTTEREAVGSLAGFVCSCSRGFGHLRDKLATKIIREMRLVLASRCGRMDLPHLPLLGRMNDPCLFRAA
jgi:hypothetical protein